MMRSCHHWIKHENRARFMLRDDSSHLRISKKPVISLTISAPASSAAAATWDFQVSTEIKTSLSFRMALITGTTRSISSWISRNDYLVWLILLRYRGVELPSDQFSPAAGCIHTRYTYRHQKMNPSDI